MKILILFILLKLKLFFTCRELELFAGEITLYENIYDLLLN